MAMMVICDRCNRGSYENGGQPICCHCGRKISPDANRVSDREPTEADILAALDFGKTVDQHLPH